MAEKNEITRRYTGGEEIFNAVSHGIGAGLSVAALVTLVVHAAHVSDAYGVVSVSLYGASLIILYTMSTLYHALTPAGAKRVFRVFDHTTIFLLIAGTYTPVCLSVLGGALGWSLFGVIWGLAVVGVIVTLCWLDAPRILTTMFYVGMGWIAVLVLQPLAAALSASAFFWMIAGGVAYTVGGVMYALKWPLKHHARFGCHEVFHLFVLLGSACFVLMMGAVCMGI